MKQTTNKLLLSLSLLTAVSLFLPATSFAQRSGSCSLCDVKKAVEKVESKVKDLINIFVTNAENKARASAQILFAPDLYAAAAQAGSAAQVGAGAVLRKANAEQMNKIVCELMIGKVDPSGISSSGRSRSICGFIKNESIDSTLSKYANTCGTDNPDACKKEANISYSNGVNRSRQPLENGSFNAATLLNNLTYNKNQTKNATNYLAYVSGISSPIGLSQAQLKELGEGANTQFRVLVRNYIAQMSLALSNFNYVLQQRKLTQTQDGKKREASIAKVAGIKTQRNQQISIAELDKDMATRRLEDPNWYTEMVKSPPSVVQRESLLLLAEIRYELYKQRMLQQRMLLTFSAMQMEFARQQKAVEISKAAGN